MQYLQCRAVVSFSFPRTGIDFKVKTLIVDGQQMRLQMWDTAGQERFHSIAKNYYQGAQVGHVTCM